MSDTTKCHSIDDVAAAGDHLIEIFGRLRIKRCSATSRQYPDDAQVTYLASPHPVVNLPLRPEICEQLILKLPGLEHKSKFPSGVSRATTPSRMIYSGRISLHNVPAIFHSRQASARTY